MPFTVLNDTGKEKEEKKDNNLPLSLLQERQAGLRCGATSVSLMASDKALAAPVIVSQQT